MPLFWRRQFYDDNNNSTADRQVYMYINLCFVDITFISPNSDNDDVENDLTDV